MVLASCCRMLPVKMIENACLEASGYAMSADIAAFLAAVGTEPLERLEWNGWAIEDSALGTILAGEASLFHPLDEEKSHGNHWNSSEILEDHAV